jgi:hypothetical protein
VSRQLSLPIGIDTNVSLRRAAPGVAKATFRTQPARSEYGRSVNVVEHRGATIPARWRTTNPIVSRKTDIASNPLCSNVALSNLRSVA